MAEICNDSVASIAPKFKGSQPVSYQNLIHQSAVWDRYQGIKKLFEYLLVYQFWSCERKFSKLNLIDRETPFFWGKNAVPFGHRTSQFQGIVMP